MELLLHQVLAGLATGAIYACMALAIVMIYQAIDHLNFAQGEMATLSAFGAWQLMQWGVPYWAAFALTVALSFVAGAAVERALFKPLRGAPPLAHIVVFIALYLIFNSVAGFVWGYGVKPFPRPFGSEPVFGQTIISSHDLAIIAVTLLLLGFLYIFFRHTRTGLAMLAAAANPQSARLAGIRVGWMTALGWGMASAIGAVAAILIAPVVFLEPNMMLGILLYGFAAAVAGGLSSPAGAVVCGFGVGVFENLAATYIPYAGRELKFPLALLLIVVILTVRPAGLFGRKSVERV
jgi:branched-chain amino acid transport system permease protein